MIDLCLLAADEAELISVLPMFRDKDGTWITGSRHHALDVAIPVEGFGFHANLRLDLQHPDHAAIVEATAPLVVEPDTPQRVFA